MLTTLDKRIEKERARDESEFERARRRWPTGFADSREEALRAWSNLSDQDRTRAAAEISRFVSTTRAIGRTHFCSFQSYLVERRWEALPVQAARPAAAAPASNSQPPRPPKTKFLEAWEREHGTREGPWVLPEKVIDASNSGPTVFPVDPSESHG